MPDIAVHHTRNRASGVAHRASARGRSRSFRLEIARRTEVEPRPRSEARSPALKLHDFFFFGLRDVLDLSDVLVGQLLDLLLTVFALVLGDLLVLLGVLDHVHRVATGRAHADARLLGLLA